VKPDAKVPLSQEILRFPFTEEEWLYIAGAVSQTLSMEGPGYHRNLLFRIAQKIQHSLNKRYRESGHPHIIFNFTGQVTEEDFTDR
jgi:hypothetical protein